MKYRLFIPAIMSSLTGMSYPLVSMAESTQPPIIVTASRTAETEDESLASVSVITRDEIEKSQARSVADLLRLEAGIDISRTGGAAASTNIFTRGSNSNHTLVLIDGVRVSSATTGTFAFGQININEIERIEIVRGPRSTQYGSEAIGGIVQIFTRKGNGYRARVGAGSFGTQEASAGLSAGKDITFNLNASTEKARGFSATNANAGFFSNPADNPYRRTNASANLGIPFGKEIQLNFMAWLNDSKVVFDENGSSQGTTENSQQVFSAKLDQQVNESWSHKLSIGYNNEQADTTSSFSSEISTNRIMYDWQNDITLSDFVLLLVGLSRYEDDAKNIDTAIVPQVVNFDRSISNNAAFMNLSYQGSTHDFLISVRQDDHSAFGSATTGLASWGWTFTSNLRAVASISNAFRAPTLNELYHPGFIFGFAGNPDLKPEKSEGGELSLRWKISNVQKLNMTYFHNNIDNLITYSGTNFQARNVASARTKGFEIQHVWQKEKWTLNTNATLQRATDNSDGSDLIRRPREKLTLAATHAHTKNSSTRLELILSSQRTDGFGTKQKLAGYGLLNLATRIKLQKHIWLDLRVDNLTNTQYEYARGFNTANQSFFFGLSYDLKK